MSAPRRHRLGFFAAVLGIALLLPSAALAAPASRTLEGRLVTYHGEEQVPGTGETRAVWFDTLMTSTGEVPLRFQGQRPAGFLNGARVRVQGTMAGGTLAAGSRAGDSEVLQAAAPVTGSRKLAILLVKFSAGATEPWTPSQAAATTFSAPNSIAAYFAEESYGQLSLTGDVYGWYTISIDTAQCSYLDIGQKARAAAQAAGVNLGAYQHLQYVFPKLNACGWSGLAQVPGRDSWLNNALNLRVSGHELSHNFGVHHASTLRCSEGGVDVALAANPASCAANEYGDPFSIMGSAATRHTHSQQLATMGWITGSSLKTVTTAGVYTIAAAEGSGTLGPRAVRIWRGDDEWFYLELRQPYGQYFDNFSLLDPAVLGVSIRIAGDWGTVIQSKLIDTLPSTSTFSDAPLGIGQTFQDPLTGISITTVTAAAGVATIAVAFPGDALPPTTPGNPQVTGTGATTAKFTWSASTDDTGVTGYRVSRNGSVRGTVTGTQFNDTGLSGGNDYDYAVVALDAAGHESGEASTSYTAPADAAAPSSPGNPHVTGTGATTARFAWSASTDDTGVTGYRVSRNGSVRGTVAGTQFNDTGLVPGAHYQYSVVALDGAGHQSSASTSSYTAPPDTTPPTVPGNLRKTKVTSSVVKLAWNASSDAVGVVGYRIYRNGNLIATTTSLSWTGNRKTKKKTYYVVAYDASGNVSGHSNTVTVPHK